MATIRAQGYAFENIEAVLFDKDGTLANVEQYLCALGWARSHQVNRQISGLAAALLATMGITEQTIDPAGLMAVASRRDNEIAAAACVTATGIGWIEALEIVSTAFVQAEKQLQPKVLQTPIIDGAAVLIDRLKLAGVKVGIVSADIHTEVEAFVEHHHLTKVDWYCGASTSTIAKTHPNFLNFACKALGAPPEQTLVIGDSAGDLAVADRGAAGFLGMVGGWQHPPAIANAKISIQRLCQVECFN